MPIFIEPGDAEQFFFDDDRDGFQQALIAGIDTTPEVDCVGDIIYDREELRQMAAKRSGGPQTYDA